MQSGSCRTSDQPARRTDGEVTETATRLDPAPERSRLHKRERAAASRSKTRLEPGLY